MWTWAANLNWHTVTIRMNYLVFVVAFFDSQCFKVMKRENNWFFVHRKMLQKNLASISFVAHRHSNYLCGRPNADTMKSWNDFCAKNVSIKFQVSKLVETINLRFIAQRTFKRALVCLLCVFRSIFVFYRFAFVFSLSSFRIFRLFDSIWANGVICHIIFMDFYLKFRLDEIDRSRLTIYNIWTNSKRLFRLVFRFVVVAVGCWWPTVRW